MTPKPIKITPEDRKAIEIWFGPYTDIFIKIFLGSDNDERKEMLAELEGNQFGGIGDAKKAAREAIHRLIQNNPQHP